MAVGVETQTNLETSIDSIDQESRNEQAFYTLLDRMREVAHSERDKGDMFERLMCQVLAIASPYSERYSKVQLYKDWAAEHPECVPNARDIGIDLVATLIETEWQGPNKEARYVAIQCKFYDQDSSVPKAEVDSFLSASSTKYFAERLLVATNRGWSTNTEQTIEYQEKPISILSLEKLKNLKVDWQQYLKDNTVKKLAKRELRQYQEEAINNVILGFKSHDRGKLIMACGTGKTFTSLKLAERQVGQHGLVLFLVPSLALLSQTLDDWTQQSTAKMTAIPVCSDSTIGDSARPLDPEDDSPDSILADHELSYPATTNAKSLADKVVTAFERYETRPDLGLTVVFSTYQSLDVIHEAQELYGLKDFDLIICDEAHRTAGAYLFNDLKEKEKKVKAKNKAAPKGKRGHKAKAAANTEVAITINENDTQQQSIETAQSSDLALDIDDVLAPQGEAEAPDWDVEAESLFTRIHNASYIHGRKRLYMTATPKIYGEAPKRQESLGDAVLYSMDNEQIFGPVFYSLNFDMAVKLGCLVDYKVLILVCDQKTVPHEHLLENFSQTQTARVIGTWKALNKYGVADELINNNEPMKRAVAFAQRIDLDGLPAGRKRDLTVASKQFAAGFNAVVNDYKQHIIKRGQEALARGETPSLEYQEILDHGCECECEHIDGSMSSVEKDRCLKWLKEEPQEGHCKILCNVRCLSEGVDVPSLDAVAFLSPRKSEVEVVQIVGRVMRRAPNKTRGYVIIPVVLTNPNTPEATITNSTEFKPVWQVLNALRSINPNNVIADLPLHKLDQRIEIISVHDAYIQHKGTKQGDGQRLPKTDEPQIEMPRWSFGEVAAIEEHIKTMIINKMGNRREWEDWAQDVGEICSRQVEHIKAMVCDGGGVLAYSANNVNYHENREAFANFKSELAAATRVKLSDDDVVEMLAQHIVIKPVLDELFRGYPFTEKNAIASAMTKMLERLDANGLTRTNDELKGFYQSVGFRMENVTSVSDRQKVIVDLFDRFFKVAFPKQQDKLGIVYTPIEVVDFMTHSVNDILQKEFGCTFSTHGVHVLDPFTGTGTFIARLLTSGLIAPEDLEYKYAHDLHAFEILPLAYYIASINIESVHNELYQKQHNGEALPVDAYKANDITVLTDTFSSSATQTELTELTTLSDNIKRRKAVESMDLRVIIGNPPYSRGQESQNDDNQNEEYPELDERIAATYVEKAGKISNKNSLYDSYIRAFRWASDKIKDRGVVAFVTNAGWVDSAAANGMRRCLQEEFSSVYVFHLKGNQRTSGEQSRKEGGKIFGSGSRAPIAITILVKNPDAAEQGQIHFACVDDYLSREEKLQQLIDIGSVLNPELKLTTITPDAHGDWFNQRRDDFANFISVDGKKNDGLAVFSNFSLGVATNRDPWSYNSSKKTITSNFERCIVTYNKQLSEYLEHGQTPEKDNTKLKWSGTLESAFKRQLYSPDFDHNAITLSMYRPYIAQWLYNQKFWLERSYQMPSLFPFTGAQNIAIGIAGVGATSFSSLMSNSIACLDCLEKSQCLPRYLYRPIGEAAKDTKTTKVKTTGQADLFAGSDAGELDASNGQSGEQVIINGYVREDAIKPEAVAHFRAAYAGHEDEIDADSVFYYIYGILHSKDYRATYANNLQKELPRIPRVATFEDFKAFEKAGRALADLHVNYEQVEPYAGCTVSGLEDGAEASDLRVTKLKYGKIAGKKGNAALDKTKIVYNDQITITDIPLEVQDYVVNKKSALDWVVERCGVSIDKASQIVNDFNNMAEEMGDPQYILHLILRVITVSLETNKIVASLPALHIHPLDQ